ncbi:unnamed protein product [marine sediment metagenome]|uniref:Uncharacterized protein n=1 Tax=marine sediment metagenome TaxID=412755 RepID=X1E0D0_9ZZZZ
MKKYLKVILLLGISLIFLTGCAVDLVVPENDVSSPASEGSSAYERYTGLKNIYQSISFMFYGFL